MHTYKLVLPALLFAASISLRADTVYLTDGTEREGTVVEQDEAFLKLRIKRGPLTATVEIPRKEISRIEFKALAADETEIEFKLLKSEAEKLATLDALSGAKAWLRFAQFCEGKPGFAGYAQSGYEKAIELEPNLAEARKALGYEFGDYGWSKPKAEPDAIVVAARKTIVPSATVPYTTITPSQTVAADDGSRSDHYATPVSSRSNYSRRTYYASDEYGSVRAPNSVVYLAPVNGYLVPTSLGYGSTVYPNTYGNYGNGTATYRSNSTYYTGGQVGRTGYYSDGYYRSNTYGVSSYFSGGGGSTRFSGTINGGGFRGGFGGSNYGVYSNNFGFRIGFR